ncbi:kelch domain-containing protein 3-like [Amblyomma americanum]
MWTVRLTGVPQRVDNNAVSIHGKIYSFDFQTVSRNLINVHTFDPASHRWDIVQTRALPNSEPIGIYRHTIVAYGHCAYVWGGWLRGMADNVLFRFDTRTMEWSRPKVSGKRPKAVCSHSACVVGRRMYIFADILSGDTSRRVWFLDLGTMKWCRVNAKGEAPTQACLHSACAIGTRMYIWGGSVEDPSAAFGFVAVDDIYYLETTSSTWVRPHVEGIRPAGRQEHSVFAYEGELYVFGGYNHEHICYADMHKYDPNKSRWTEVKPVGSGPSSRYAHGCCTIGEKVFVFGGNGPLAYPRGRPLKDMYILHLAPTLKNLCVLAVIDAGLDFSRLPPIIRDEINSVISS